MKRFYCTYFDRNYLPKAPAMIESLVRHDSCRIEEDSYGHIFAEHQPLFFYHFHSFLPAIGDDIQTSMPLEAAENRNVD